ncbi:MAG: hypothetical protein ACOYMS_13205 [Terrimicrobiaceae bacterium]
MILKTVWSVVSNAPWLKKVGWLGTAIPTVFFAAALRAEHVLPEPQFVPGSGIEMKLTNFYEDIPPSGFLPLRVEVKNDSNATRTWQLTTRQSQSNTGSMQSVFALRAEARSARTFDLLVPLVTEPVSGSRYSNIQISITGHGTARTESRENSRGSGSTPTVFLGMGKVLAVKNWGPLREQLDKKHSLSLEGTALNPELLPADWRALAGFGIIILADSEWRIIPAAQRAALQDWVIQGGRLILCHSGFTPAADLPAAEKSGCGSIELWSLGDDFSEKVKTTLLASPVGESLKSYTWQWPLARDVGRPEPPQTLIMVFVLLFALVIGPLNFLVFAPAGNRHRLFWTTPLISLASSALMGLFILFSEGIGGSGQRFAVQLSLPAFNKSVLWQEQASRTGVLTSGAFVLAEPALLVPAGLHATNSFRPNSDRGKSYSLDGATWSGDWFRSRTTQAQIFTAVSAARTRLDVSVSPDGKPVAVSSFENELKELWCFDDTGEPWRAANVKPGEKRTLERAALADFTAWLNQILEPAGGVTRERAEKFYAKDGKGKFFASMENPALLSSLPSIRWKDKDSLLLGLPVVPANH